VSVNGASGLPSSWRIAMIGELCDLKNGRAFKPSDWARTGLPIVRIQNLNNPEAPFNYYDGEVSDRFRIESGNLLFAWSGTPGTSFGAHIWRGGNAVLNQHIFRVDFDECLVDKSYLRYAINDRLNELIEKAHGGVGLRHVTKGKFEETTIPIPPFHEQRRIVAKIEELFSELDKGIEALTTAREQLKAYRQSVLKQAFEGKLTADFRHGKSATWTTLPVCHLLNEPLCNGRSVKDRSGGFPVLRLTALKGGRIDLTESKEGNWNRADALPFLISSGDFFVARGNGSIQLVGIGGLVSEATREVAFPDTMIRLRLKTALVDPRYFAMCWNSRIVRQQIEREARTTAGIYKINQDHISHFTLPVPPIEEQRLIVSRVDEKLSEADSAIEQISNDLLHGIALRQSILKRAFSGQLVAQSPNDEPASVLLERIRAARESAPAKNGRNGRNSHAKNGEKNRKKQFTV
jgi:type I restriction enzyme S subunit